MQNILIHTLTLVWLLVMPQISFAQAPTLGATSGFALFTKVGSIANIGTSTVTGDIGTNSGSITGYTAGMINGQIHVLTATSAQAATDVTAAYNFLGGVTCGTALGIGLGGGQVLTPSVYCISAASTLTGDLTLNAQGDPNALFIFRIEGALSVSTLSNVLLINGASLSNVYWQIQGAFELGASAVFRGNLITSGAISLSESAILQGRGLTIAGAISTNTATATKPANVALPIEIMSFTAQKEKNDVLLHWITASEQDNLKIELQKKGEKDFATVAIFKGYGTTNEKQYYSFVDEMAFDKVGYLGLNIIYYRLKQTDRNGTFKYSNIISIANDINKTVYSYPNPVSDELIIKNIADNQIFFVTNVLGQTVIHGQYNADTALNVSALQTGYYVFNTQAVKIKFFKN